MSRGATIQKALQLSQLPMTEVKRYPKACLDSGDRDVALLLWLTPQSWATSGGHPLRNPLLFDRALACAERVDEAAEKLFWADDTSLLEQFERRAPPSIHLLSGPPPVALQKAHLGPPLSRFVICLDGLCPFLRPSSVDEAIRLMKVRCELSAIMSCVRVHGPFFEANNESARGPTEPLLRRAAAFELTLCEAVASFSPDRTVAHPFEISAGEAFRVDSPLTFELATAYVAQNLSRAQ